jgi:hypothetical protein
MRIGRYNERIYDSWLSTENQLRLSATRDARFEFHAQLRLDALFFRTLVVPDTAVIDGWYLGQTSPEELVTICGRGTLDRWLPLEIRCREKTLEQSLANFLRRGDRGTLNDYPLQMLRDPEAREAIRDGLRQTSVSKLDQALGRTTSVPEAIGTLLDDILKSQGITEHTVEKFVPYWEQWIAAEKTGAISVVPWTTQMAAGPAAQQDPLDPELDLVSDDGRAAYRAIVQLLSRERSYKSDAINALVGTPPTPHSDKTESATNFEWDRTTILDWYDRGRMRALAHQHAAAFAYDEPTWEPDIPNQRASSSLIRTASELPVSERFHVSLPNDFRASVALMPSEQYAALFTRHRPVFESLWTTATTSAARRVAEIAYEAASSHAEKRSMYGPERLVRVFGQLLAAGATTKVAGPVAGVGMILASEAVLQRAEMMGDRAVTRAAVEYMNERIDATPIASDG